MLIIFINIPTVNLFIIFFYKRKNVDTSCHTTNTQQRLSSVIEARLTSGSLAFKKKQLFFFFLITSLHF